MSNLGSVFRQEIARIARKELRAKIGTTKKASAQHRRHIATLRRRIEMLERKIASLAGNGSGISAAPAPETNGEALRFVAKGVRSLRTRLGLSADRFAQLVGVSAQSVYNWERKISTPRDEQLRVLASLRGIGKREASARLDSIDAASSARKSPRARTAPRK